MCQPHKIVVVKITHENISSDNLKIGPSFSNYSSNDDYFIMIDNSKTMFVKTTNFPIASTTAIDPCKQTVIKLRYEKHIHDIDQIVGSKAEG